MIHLYFISVIIITSKSNLFFNSYQEYFIVSIFIKIKYLKIIGGGYFLIMVVRDNQRYFSTLTK